MLTKTEFIETLQRAFTSVPEESRCEGCPEPEVLWAAVNLELPAEERREVVRHTAVCAACAENWRVAWDLVKAREEFERNENPHPPLNGHPSWFGENLRKVAAQVAAAGLVVLAVGVAGVMFHQVPQPNFRGDTNPAMQAASNRTPDDAVLPRNEFFLRWPGTKGAVYELLIMTEDGDILDTKSDFRHSEYQVPREVFQNIPRGSTILWSVSVRAPQSGERVLGPFSVTLQ